MKTFFTVLVEFLFLNNSAQSFLAKGQMFDFNVGDVFQAKLYSYSPTIYYTKKTLTKTIFGNIYSIEYGIQTESYTSPACFCCNPTYTLNTSNFVVVNLNDTIIDKAASSIKVIDSMVSVLGSEAVNACNKKTRVHYQIPGSTITLSPLNIYG